MVRPPADARQDPKELWDINVPLYGWRKASASWQDYQAEQLVHVGGFRRSVVEGCAFRNDEIDVTP